MATESLPSDHHSPDKTMEKVFEETQIVKLEGVDPPKEVGEKDEEEELDADGLAGSETPGNKLEETTGIQTKFPAAVEVETVEDTPVVDVHVETDSEKIENCALNPDSLSASGPGDEAVETQSGAPEKQCIMVEIVDNPSLVDAHVEDDSEKIENCALNPESLSASGPGDEAVETQSGAPDKQSIVVENVDNPALVDVHVEADSEKMENCALNPESLFASGPGNEAVETQSGAPEKQSIVVEKADNPSLVHVHVEADSEKIENCALNPESLSASEAGDEAVETQSGAPEKQCIVVEKVDNPSPVDVPAEVDLKVVENSIWEPESDSASKPGEMPEEHSVDVLKVDDGPIVDIPTETGSKMVENSVLEPESSSASEPGGEIFERQLEAPKEDTTVVEKVDDDSVADVRAEAGPKMVENSVLEPESSPSEPSGAAVDSLSEEHPTVVEKDDDATTVDVPCEASLEVVENSVLDPESSSASKPGDEMAERQREVLEEHPVEVEKVDNIPIVDFPAEAGVKTIENSFVNAELPSPSEPCGETVQGQLEATSEHSTTEIAETQQQEQVAAEGIEQPEEKPSVGTAEPNLSIKAVDKPVEHLEVIPVKESELEVAKVPEAFSEAECKIAESPGLVTKVEGETGERAEVIKGVEGEIEEVKPSESLGGEVMTSEGTMADKCEGNESLKEEETSLDQEPVAYENSVPTNQEAQVDPKEEEGDSSTSDVIVAAARATDKEGGGNDVVERFSKDETVVAAKVEEEKEEKNLKIEDNEGKSTEDDESIQTETAKTDDRNGFNFVAEVAEIDREQVSRDVEVVAEVKKLENVKEDMPLSVEANKHKDGEGKFSEVDAKETVKTNGDNLESAKADGETAKSNPPKLETLKNGDDPKTSAKPAKQDDSVKKHSNNLISKVKQSIVKVKKAIIGKSPSSKALLPEAKGDEKVK